MALRLFDHFQPSAIIGFGGYPALPALLAATAAKLPSIVHEQNARAAGRGSGGNGHETAGMRGGRPETSGLDPGCCGPVAHAARCPHGSAGLPKPTTPHAPARFVRPFSSAR